MVKGCVLGHRYVLPDIIHINSVPKKSIYWFHILLLFQRSRKKDPHLITTNVRVSRNLPFSWLWRWGIISCGSRCATALFRCSAMFCCMLYGFRRIYFLLHTDTTTHTHTHTHSHTHTHHTHTLTHTHSHTHTHTHTYTHTTHTHTQTLTHTYSHTPHTHTHTLSKPIHL